MNSGPMVKNGNPLQTPVSWHLGAIVGLTVIALLVIWVLTGLARYAEETGSASSRDTRSTQSADYTPWKESSIPSVRTEILHQFPDRYEVLEEITLQDEGDGASQQRFKIETPE